MIFKGFEIALSQFLFEKFNYTFFPPFSRTKRSFATSIRRLKRSATERKNGPAGGTNCRKQSTMNTSGASILYPGRMTAKDRRLLKMIMVILVAFIMCYLPITTTKIVRSIREVPYLNIMGYLFIYLTTCINPIIYVVMSSEYRQAYVNLLMCRIAGASVAAGRRGERRPANNDQQLAQHGSQRT